MVQKDSLSQPEAEFIVGPIRVTPGRLSVCRTFGDPEAKVAYRGGNPNVVKALPDIRYFRISATAAMQPDFIILASDGIFDKLSDSDIGKAVWMTCDSAKKEQAQQEPRQNIGVAGDSINVH